MKCEAKISCFNEATIRIVYVKRSERNSPKADQHSAYVCRPCLAYSSGVPLIWILEERTTELTPSEARTDVLLHKLLVTRHE